MSKTINIELPLFPGFYESDLYNSDMLYYEVNDECNMEYYRDLLGDDSLKPDDLDIDFSAYQKECNEYFCDAFECLSPDFVERVKYTDMSSPRYYNFETDRIYADVRFADDWKEQILKFMIDNKEWLAPKIKEDWSDRDGFWSFMPNDYDEWVAEFKKDDDDVDRRFINVMLAYIMKHNYKEIRWHLCEYVLDNVYISCYIFNTKDKETSQGA